MTGFLLIATPTGGCDINYVTHSDPRGVCMCMYIVHVHNIKFYLLVLVYQCVFFICKLIKLSYSIP